jgi:hypothetical protein
MFGSSLPEQLFARALAELMTDGVLAVDTSMALHEHNVSEDSLQSFTELIETELDDLLDDDDDDDDVADWEVFQSNLPVQ